MIILTSEQRQIETLSAQNGFALDMLMERAGKALFLNIEEKLRKKLKGINCAVLCGKGGNGGDGFAAAKFLKEGGAVVNIILCHKEITNVDAKNVLEKAIALNIKTIELEKDAELAQETVIDAQVIIDAIYGVGFHGKLNERISRLVALANENKSAYKISADIPSGVGADSGLVCENAFCAEITIAMVGYKLAHIFKSSSPNCGRVVLVEIGIPSIAYELTKLTVGEISEQIAARILPKRESCSYKGSFGKLLLIAGSERYRGAAVLCTKGALNCGAGLISVASCEKVLETIATSCPEAVLIDIKMESRFFIDSLTKSTSCAIGCGLSMTNSVRGFVETVIETAKCPLIIDADGINVLSENINLLKGHKQPIVLTPHLGEFSRLCGKSVDEIRADKVEIVKSFASEYDVTLVLKSENTLVVFPTKEIFVCTKGNSGLAKGGSGDLLCGCIASISAMGVSPSLAAMLGVYIHSSAADIAARTLPLHSITASNVAEYIPAAISELELV